jgi:hypothetical protein
VAWGLWILASCSGPAVDDTADTPADSPTETADSEVPQDSPADTSDTGEARTYTAVLDADGTLTVTVGTDTWTLTTVHTDPGPDFTWTRSLTLEADRLLVHDTLSSTAEVDLGVALTHTISPPDTPVSVHLAGVRQAAVDGGATNPTTLQVLETSQFGTVAADALGWVQFQASTDGTEVQTGPQGVHLPPGASHTLTLALYPQPGGDYWDFLNRARQDFAPPVTVPHWEFGPSATVWDTHGALEPYLARRDLQVGAALPFLDYDNAWIAQGLDIAAQRDAYLAEATRALDTLHAADPELVVLTELEGVFTQLTADQSAELVALLTQAERWAGYPKVLTQAQDDLLQSWGLAVLDSLPLTDSGRGAYELYVRDDTTLIALLTYPEAGTTALANLMDQVRFSLETVQAGGFFLDGSGPANDFLQGPGDDGATAVVDLATGALLETRRDYRLTIAEALVPLVQDALDAGAFVAANGYANTPELNALPVLRFMETGWLFDPLDVAADGMPARIPEFATGHLGCPVALGNVPSFYGAEDRAAEFVMRDVIARLAHGLIYAGYNTELPEEGPGAGSWEALNAMFPLTPVSLHPGWVIGAERTVTAVSGAYAWSGDDPPVAKCYGLDGASTACAQAAVSGGAGTWTLDLALDDWDQLAVIDGEALSLELLAWWAMDGATSGPVTTLLDSVGDRDLTHVLAAPAFSDSDPAEGTAFTTGWDGGSTGLYKPDPGFLDAAAWTFEAWVRRADADAAGCFYGNGHVDAFAGLARVCLYADGTVEAKLVGDSAGSSGNPHDLVAWSAPDDAAWHHLALTWTGGLARTYVDHTEVGAAQSTPEYNGRLLTDYAYLTIGFANDTTDTPGAWWSGDLDAIRLSTRVLGPDEFL